MNRFTGNACNKKGDKMARVTQRDMVLQYIHDFGFITSWQAYQDLGISQLATRIFELKERGYVFTKKRVSTKNRYGKPTHYDEYRLAEERKHAED